MLIFEAWFTFAILRSRVSHQVCNTIRYARMVATAHLLLRPVVWCVLGVVAWTLVTKSGQTPTAVPAVQSHSPLDVDQFASHRDRVGRLHRPQRRCDLGRFGCRSLETLQSSLGRARPYQNDGRPSYECPSTSPERCSNPCSNPWRHTQDFECSRNDSAGSGLESISKGMWLRRYGPFARPSSCRKCWEQLTWWNSKSHEQKGEDFNCGRSVGRVGGGSFDKVRVGCCLCQPCRDDGSRAISGSRTNPRTDSCPQAQDHHPRRSSLRRFLSSHSLWEKGPETDEAACHDVSTRWNIQGDGYTRTTNFPGMDRLLESVSCNPFHAATCRYPVKEGGHLCSTRGILRKRSEARGGVPGGMALDRPSRRQMQSRSIRTHSPHADQGRGSWTVAHGFGIRSKCALDWRLHLCGPRHGVLEQACGEARPLVHCEGGGDI